ncbi:flagellin [Sphingomonas sp. IW22]|uniref:flagellin N-terminal helical domain-containing protein n=1 Tax=Sphingomonas sp. IW22 TaxID=3242489 RepID=UPI00351FF9B0
MNRIATSQYFSRSLTQMSGLNVAADKLQTQIATGKKLTAASQDAAAWTQLATMKRDTADHAAAKGNIELASGILAQADSTLENITQQLQRAQELAMTVGSGTIGATERNIVADQLDIIKNDILALANQKDVRGVPMFGGGADAAFAVGADGAITYVGGTAPGTIPVADGADVQVTEDGSQLAQMFTALEALALGIRNGDDLGTISADLGLATDNVSAARASVGARGMRLDMEMERLDEVAIGREEARGAIEQTDVTAAITELQKTLTILSATQASFTKLSGLSLFDQLR